MDDDARFVKKSTMFWVKSWLEDGLGPNRFRVDTKGKQLLDMYRDAEKRLCAAKQNVAAVCDTPEIVNLDMRQERQRTEALEKARSRLAKRAPSKRVRCLTPPTKQAKLTDD